MSGDPRYEAQGYVVRHRVVPDALIDACVEVYERDVLAYQQPLLRQSTFRERHALSADGAMTNALLNPHSLKGPLEHAARAIRAITDCRPLADALTETTGFAAHSVLQTMMFEQSITEPHQDWVYLDSRPAGHLVAAWIALEDISPEASRFFVVPGSQGFQRRFTREQVLNGDYTQAMQAVVDEIADQITVPMLSKGDVLFWNSGTIHGSIEGRDPARTRRSLACHFLPQGFASWSIADRPILTRARRFIVRALRRLG